MGSWLGVGVSLSGRGARRAAGFLLAAAYLWPLELAPEITSSFGEYRSGHFHGGLDFSTRRAVGHPVRAVGGGEVARVRASGAGYGRAVYLRLDDGRTAVYAHLDAFAGPIADWVAALQESTGRYELDRVPPAGRFRYERGALIGLSGQSGAGPPHLHFEIRQGEIGINPLAVGFAVADHAAPTIAALWAYPAAAASRVRGGTEPVRIPARREGGVWRLTERVQLQGPVRVALEAADRTHVRDNPLGLYAVSARLDAHAVYEARFDSASWLRATEVDAVYDMVVRTRSAREAIALTPPPGLTGGVVRKSEPAWERPPGRYGLDVELEDAAGNRARLAGNLEWVHADSLGAVARARPSAGGLTLEWTRGALTARAPAGVRLAVEPPLAEAGPQVGPETRTWEVPSGFEGPLRVRAFREAAGGETLAVGERRLRVAEVAPGWSRTIRSPDGRFSVTIGADSPFETQAVAIEEWDVAPGTRAPFGRIYQLMPDWLVLRSPVELSWDAPDSAAREGLGLFAAGSGGNLIGGADSTGGRLAGSTRRFGSFTARYDGVPPVIGPPRVLGARRGGASSSGVVSVRWGLTDAEAGVASSDVVVEVDGRAVPVEYDVESAALVWRPRQRPERGRHSYRIEARDRLGARALRSGDFLVP